MTISLLGISGNRGHGKDTLTSVLINDVLPQFELHGKRESFAHRLKVSAARALGYVEESEDRCVEIMDAIKREHSGSVSNFALTYSEDGVTWHEGANKTITGREFLQFYGTEAHRNVFGTDFWVDQVLPKSKSPWERYVESEPWDVTVVSDARFPNEAERIRHIGGKIIRVVRPDLETEDAHSSEVPLPDELVDYTLINDDLTKLPEKAAEAWRKLNG